MGNRIHRRHVLLALIAVGGATGLARVARFPPFGREEPGILGDLLSHRQSAERIGRVYLRDHPEEADPEILKKTIAGSPAEAARLFGEMGAEELADWVWSRQQEDFREGRTVDLDGWTLSRTEARLCALLSVD